jgi:hypothetical protein
MEQEKTQFLTYIYKTLPRLTPQELVGDQGYPRAETPPDPDYLLSLSSELGEDHYYSNI